MHVHAHMQLCYASAASIKRKMQCNFNKCTSKRVHACSSLWSEEMQCNLRACNATCVLAYLRTGVGGGIVEDGGKGVGGVERGRPFHGSGYDFAVCGCTCNAAHVLSRNMVHRGGSAQTATRALFCSTDVLWTTSAPHGSSTARAVRDRFDSKATTLATVAQASQLFSATDALFTRKNTMSRANPDVQIASMV